MAYFNRNDRSGGRRSFGGGRDFRGRGQDRQMYKAVCAKCGKECEVPFKPSDRPVYCNECFKENRRSDDRRPEGRNFSRPNFDKRHENGNRGDQSPQYKEQFEKLNHKVDKILNLLSTLVIAKQAPVIEEKIVKPSRLKSRDIFNDKAETPYRPELVGTGTGVEEVKDVEPEVQVIPPVTPKKKRKSSKKATPTSTE